MKKLAAVLLSILVLASCSSGVSQSEYDAVAKERDALKAQAEMEKTIPETDSKGVWNHDDEKTTKEKQTGFDVEDITDKLEIEEYTWKGSSYYYLAIAVKNNSEYEIDLSAEIHFFDDSSTPIGAKDETNEAIAPSSNTVFVFMNDAPFASYTYELNPSENTYYKCVAQNIAYEESIADSKAIITAKNTGSFAIDFPKCIVIFFNGENAVGYDEVFIMDNDSQLKPDKTKSEELKCRSAFDNIKVFFTGIAYE